MMQFGAGGVWLVHCALLVHAVPLEMPSGKKNGVPSGCSTMPHTGQLPMPEQLGSAQSTRPSQSLSIPSLHAAGVFSGVQSPLASAPCTSSPLWCRAAGPHANASQHDDTMTSQRVLMRLTSPRIRKRRDPRFKRSAAKTRAAACTRN
jgi:hypothetical protein